MSYPQPNADQYSLKGYKFFRLNTALLSDGDIYQSAQGAQAFAIGPESDIANINIAYFDDQAPNYMNQIAISPSRPFIGEFLARNEAAYAPSQQPGRTLIWPGNLFSATYRPEAFDPAFDRIDIITPVIEVVQYFQPTEIDNSERNDKTYYYPILPIGELAQAASYYIVIPYYGRRMAQVAFSNGTNGAGGNIDVALTGLRYIYTSPVGADGTQIGTASLGEGDSYLDTVKASVEGSFDALQFRVTIPGPITGIAGATLRVTVSDKEA